MTILAGVFSCNPSVRIPDSVCDSLKRNISRDPTDHPIEFRDAQAFFVKVDIGAFDRPAHRVSPAGSIAILAGEPLLTCEGPAGPDRDAHLTYLQTKWDDGDFQSLCSASGTFCAAYYDPCKGIAHLVADRLGLRPLYYTVVGDYVYFASALRILEALSEIPKKLDVLAVAEITGFGYPFGGGTPYAGIKMLLPCEVITVHQGKFTSQRYFQWDSIAPVQATAEEALKETHRLFQSAVRRRLHGDRTTFAYLSGGLDSRCTVAALRAENARVYTFNFSLENTQDQAFALAYANKSGAIHHELPTEPGPNWSAVMADAWRTSPRRQEQMPEHPNVVWTGEGGSVGLGYVYVSPEIVSLLRSGDLDGAIDVYLRQQNKIILTRILDPDLAKQFYGHLHARLRSELEAIRHPDPVRAFYIFLNLNGPRRHLVNHFDSIDKHRLEFQVPFYDSELLEYLTAIAVDPCLYHQFYVKWLTLFDSAVSEVPWQAYPGHVPSPIPIPEDLPDQWNALASGAHQAALDRDLLEQSAVMLSDTNFPRRVLRKRYLKLMRLAWRLRLGNYGYALKAALAYYHYLGISSGRYELPGARSANQGQTGL
jgi:asparagine synthase (glutamine-hydrolysing)